MARQRDYAAEYRRRLEHAETPEQRERARGHRGPSTYEGALRSARAVYVYGAAGGPIFAKVVTRTGRTQTYTLQRHPRRDEVPSEADKDRMRRRIEDQLDAADVESEVNISP